MTVFTDTWDASYEAIPSDNEDINEGANRIRDFKVAVRQRLAVDHSWAGDANDGKHNQATLRVQGGDPSLDTGDGALYAKVVSSITELFYKDSAGTVTQVTTNGAVKVTPAFPTGTKMVFLQAAPPTGWTQDASLTDRTLLFTNGGGGGTLGGSWTISGLTSNVAAHTLTEAEIPSHHHSFTIGIDGTAGGSPAAGSTFAIHNNTAYNTDNTGGGGSHGHAGSTISADSNWRPAYILGIAATKD